ncbi:unnamed protein product [Rotaria sp. Silwood2]|nr:unnamed protein product [Rotaria sp. Silwood2]CAF4434158.1 unnamed protein product [Rotaria sp. Silwood2]
MTEALWKFYKAPTDDNTDVVIGKKFFHVLNEVSSKLNHITNLIQAKQKKSSFYADNDNNQNQLIITLFSKKCKFSINLNSTNNQTIDDEQDDEMCQVFGGAEAEDLVDNKN